VSIEVHVENGSASPGSGQVSFQAKFVAGITRASNAQMSVQVRGEVAVVSGVTVSGEASTVLATI
jgi:hypothetical protein